MNGLDTDNWAALNQLISLGRGLYKLVLIYALWCWLSDANDAAKRLPVRDRIVTWFTGMGR